MKRFPVMAATVACLAVGVLVAQSAKAVSNVVGICQDFSGIVTITRGKSTVIYDYDINPGVTKILDGDMIRTESDGQLTFQADKNTGFRGEVVIKANTTLYVRIQDIKGSKKTTVDIVTGSIGSKLTKIAGSPSLIVNSESAVMAVRGTEFTASASINGNVLFTCTEGSVDLVETSGSGSVIALPAGKAAESRSGARMAFVDTTGIDLKRFSDRWMTDETVVFKGNVKNAVEQFMRFYDENKIGLFDDNYGLLEKSDVAKRWMAEDDAIQLARANPASAEKDLTVRRDAEGVNKIKPLLFKIQRRLFIFERVYYRVLEIKAITDEDPSLLKLSVRPGVTVGDFVRRIVAERDQIAKRIAYFRYIERLAMERSLLVE